MSHFVLDDADWETVVERRPCAACDGGKKPCRGGCNGMLSIGTRRRDPVEAAKIKAERERKREDAILEEADAIRARRATNDLGTTR